MLAPHSEQGATSRRNRPDIRYIPMAQRRTQLQVQDLRTISFQSWRATAQQDKRDDLEANHQTVRVRIASMRLGDESEEQDSGDEQEEEEDAVTGPSPEQDHPHSQSQPGPSTSQMTDAQHAVQEQLREAGNLAAVESMQSELEQSREDFLDDMSVDLGIRTGTVRTDHAVNNGEASGFLNDWWKQTGLAAKRTEAAHMDGETFLERNGQTNRHRTDA